MRARVALVCALVACGRVRFDPAASGIGGDGASSGDGGTCKQFDRTYPVTSLGIMGLTWIGDRYVVLTLDGLAAIGSDGLLGAFQPVTPALAVAHPGNNAIAWTGSELVATWTTSTGDIDIGRFDASLAQIVSAWDVNESMQLAGR